MTDEIRYEIVRLRTLRSTYWLIGLGLLLNAALAGVIAWSTRHDPPDPNTLAALMTSGSAFSPLPFLAVLVGLVGAFAFGHEYRHRTITVTLSALPRRDRLVLAKAIVLAVTSALIAVIGLALNWSVASLLTQRILPIFSNGLTPVMVGFVAYVVLWGLLGLALGLLVRNLPVVVTLLFVVPLLVEPLLAALTMIPALHSLSGATAYFPFNAGSQLTNFGSLAAGNRGPSDAQPLSRHAGGLVFAGWTAAVLAAGWVLFKRRDA